MLVGVFIGYSWKLKLKLVNIFLGKFCGDSIDVSKMLPCMPANLLVLFASRLGMGMSCWTCLKFEMFKFEVQSKNSFSSSFVLVFGCFWGFMLWFGIIFARPTRPAVVHAKHGMLVEWWAQ